MSIVLRKGLRTACAAAAMTTAWGATPAQAVTQDATVETNFSSALQDAYLLYGFNVSGLVATQAVLLSENVGAGVQQFPVTLGWEDAWHSDPFPYLNWTVMGVIDEDRVSVTMTDGYAQQAITNGSDWDDAFFVGYTEAQVYSFLQFGATTDLVDWFQSNVGNTGNLYINDTGTQVDFSVASDNGTARLYIPEPTTMTLVGLGVIPLLGRRRV